MQHVFKPFQFAKGKYSLFPYKSGWVISRNDQILLIVNESNQPLYLFSLEGYRFLKISPAAR